jgi:prepilin-type N-terminal cleavage/methylation domain-containing protein
MKKGFTLIELLVYMMIMGFIIVVAGRVFSDSTSMRIRTQNMASSTEEINRVAALIREDLSQMGAKEYRDITASLGDDDVFEVINDVYMGTGTEDFSSFRLEHRDFLKNDSIAFKKIAFNDKGEYTGVRLITWALVTADSTLRRRCVKFSSVGTPDDPCDDDQVIVMATNITEFGLLPSKPGAKDGISSSSGSADFGLWSNGNSGTDDCVNYKCFLYNSGSATLSGFKQNSSNSSDRYEFFVGEPSPSTAYKEYELKKDETYFVTFKTPLPPKKNNVHNDITLFQPKVDHASVGFRKNNGEIIEGLNDFLFYIPQTKDYEVDTISHYFEFSVPKDESKALAMFTFAFYGPASNGTVIIEDFHFGKKNEAYHFVREGDGNFDLNYATIADDDIENKEKVRAFELYLEINRMGETGSTRPVMGLDGNMQNGYLIPTPNNGLRPYKKPQP